MLPPGFPSSCTQPQLPLEGVLVPGGLCRGATCTLWSLGQSVPLTPNLASRPCFVCWLVSGAMAWCPATVMRWHM